MSKTVDIFIALLRNAITGTKEEIDLSDINWESLYSLAKFHDLAHIIFYEINKRDVLREGELHRKFKNQYDIALYRHIKREHAIEQIRAILEKAKIPFILLKGVVLMDLYPEPWMRTSSDVDVLVRKEDHEKVCNLFKQSDWSIVGSTPHDVSFSQNGFHVEVHHTLIEDGRVSTVESVLNNVWERTIATCGAECCLNDEIFYFYHIAHMAKHFKNGGNGVRTIIDTWLLNHKTSFDQTKRDELLIEGGLMTFDKRAKELADYWFSGMNPNDPLDDFEEYIINGGIYGTKDQKIAVGVKKSDGRLKYYIRRIFLPYSDLKYSYPFLKKAPILLPFCWVIRWFKLLNPKVRQRAKEEIRIENSMDVSESDRIKSLMQNLEIW